METSLIAATIPAIAFDSIGDTVDTYIAYDDIRLLASGYI